MAFEKIAISTVCMVGLQDDSNAGGASVGLGTGILDILPKLSIGATGHDF